MTRRMATLEVTLTGPHVRFEAEAAFAVTGAEFELTLDDAPVEMNRPVEARPGAVLKFGERLTRRARVHRALPAASMFRKFSAAARRTC